MFVEKKIDYKLEFENVWVLEMDIYVLNLFGKVLCFVMEDGVVVFDFCVICEYVDMLLLVGKLILLLGCECVEVCCWEVLGDGVFDVVVVICFEYMLCEEG